MLNSGLLVSGTWLPDSNRYRDSGFLKLKSEFQSLDCRFHKQIFPRLRILQAKISQNTLMVSADALNVIHLSKTSLDKPVGSRVQETFAA